MTQYWPGKVAYVAPSLEGADGSGRMVGSRESRSKTWPRGIGRTNRLQVRRL